MKKVFIVVITMLLCFHLSGCVLVNLESQADDETPKAEFCTVTFNSLGGSPVTTQLVKKGEKAREPNPPTKKCRCEFDGWYLGDEKWSFIGYTVTENITLTSKWVKCYKCFGLSDKEYEIIKDLKIFKEYTWRDVKDIQKSNCYYKDYHGNEVLDMNYIKYTITFKDGKTYTYDIGKSYFTE